MMIDPDNWLYVLILVEGTTEATFVDRVLVPHCAMLRIHLTPIVITTKRSQTSAPNYKGGSPPYAKVQPQIKQLLNNSNARQITTMIDFYGLEGKDFPGWSTLPIGSCYDQVEHLEKHLSNEFSERFVPYFALHEFEAMLFAEPEKFRNVFPRMANMQPRSKGKPQYISRLDQLIQELKEIKTQFDEAPETINSDYPPSKRILSLIEGYRKVDDGVNIASEIGLTAIRRECPHFNVWLTQLEALAAP